MRNLETGLWDIGTTYKTRGKHPQVCTIIDVHTTYNRAGEVVRIRYVSTHQFCGQTIIDAEVVDTTVAMGAFN